MKKIGNLLEKKITVDPKGEIVVIKGIKLDKLNKEFILLKTSTKLKKDEEKEKKIKKKKINKEEILKDDKTITKDNNNDNMEKNKTNENQKNKTNKLLPKLKNKFRGSTKEILEENSNKSRLLKKLEEGPIMPSGSNFEIMSMEVGVSIKENEKYKTGGKDFYHKYNKYSMANYNQKLKETTEINSFLKTHVENENPMTKSDLNYMGNYTDTYNTYNSSVGFINNSNFNPQNQNSKMYQFNTLSNFGNSSIKKKEFNTSLSPRLKLSFRAGSLMSSMEQLNLITERQERLAKKTENIFKKKYS